MFISQAWADAAATTAKAAEPAAAGGSAWASMLPLLLIFVLFYLLVIRPQSKRIKEHQEMLGALKPGDKVVTGGGLYATVVKIDGNDVVVEIASGVQVKAQKHTVTSLQALPVAANDSKDKK